MCDERRVPEEAQPVKEALVASERATADYLLKAAHNLREKMLSEHERHVPFGDLVNDRWELAKRHGFGEGASIYDTSVILGDVSVGKHCWIGPFTLLDGAHAPLVIGDYTSVGSGAQVYTHTTYELPLTALKAKPTVQPTRIGPCCFIAPMVIIAPGTVLGDHCFVAPGSYVQGFFPPFTYLAGNPAKRCGVVKVKEDRAWLKLDEGTISPKD